MKKLILIISILLITNILFSQIKVENLAFKISSVENIKTSTLNIYYVFSDAFYKLNHNRKRFSIYINNKKTNDSSSNNISYIRGVIEINGVGPGCAIYVKAMIDNKIISDTTIVSDSIKLIYIKDTRKVSFNKDFDFKKDNIDFAVEGPLLDKNGEIFGSYCEKGIFKQRIKNNGPDEWIKKNGIIGVLSDGRPFLFNGIDPYFQEDGINYYNTGLYFVEKNVVFKQYKKTIPVSWFFQNGPILIQDGKIINNTNKALMDRAAICFDGQRMYYAISLKPISIHDFSYYLFFKKGIDKAILIQNVGYSDKYGEYGNFKKNKKEKIIFYK